VGVDNDLEKLFRDQGAVATSGQILRFITRHEFEKLLNAGILQRIWTGIYCLGQPDDWIRLRGLDLSCGVAVPVCLATAAAIYGFDVKEDPTCMCSIRRAISCAPPTV
jgi:hypothetical protein